MSNPEQGIRLRSSARTSTGQVRDNNEDNIHLWTHDDFVLAIVADGMGGAAAGEEASRIAVETIKAGFIPQESQSPMAFDSADGTLVEKLRDTINTANLTIFEKANASPEFRGMGTTLTLSFVRETFATFAHVGDSRAYLVDGSDSSISQITSDHSFVQALVMAGHITPEEAINHPMGNVLYRALGQAEEVDIDMYHKRLHVGDRLVLCSDGLTRHVKPEEIAEIVLSDSNPDVVSQKLIDLTNERGGEDNVSVIVISVEGNQQARRPVDQAVMASQVDEEATLILKERPFSRTNDPADTLPLAPPGFREKLRKSDQTDDHKMKAERLKDEGGEDSNSNAPQPPVELFFDPPPSRRSDLLVDATAPRRDTHSEGRDTLLPDQ